MIGTTRLVYSKATFPWTSLRVTEFQIQKVGRKWSATSRLAVRTTQGLSCSRLPGEQDGHGLSTEEATFTGGRPPSAWAPGIKEHCSL